MNTLREIPEHPHSHSLYVHCLECKSFGINTPTRFVDAAPCGNCGSIETVKYYPSCCITADRAQTKEDLANCLTAYSAIENNVLWMVSPTPPGSYKHVAKLVPWGKVEDEPESEF